eukprot:16440447-Heterocapsa_arctica.AAC.1
MRPHPSSRFKSAAYRRGFLAKAGSQYDCRGAVFPWLDLQGEAYLSNAQPTSCPHHLPKSQGTPGSHQERGGLHGRSYRG